MSIVKLGSMSCVPAGRLRDFCWMHNVPVDAWEGRANLFQCPAGREPGTGAVLLSYASLKTLKGDADHTLTFEDDAGKVELKRITVTRAECVVPAAADDDGRIYFVELADRRFHLLRRPINRSFNAVSKGGTSPEYHSATTNGGSPWTWQQLVTELWTLCGLSGTPTLPATPHGTPQEFTFWGGVPNRFGRAANCWDALCDVLDRLALVPDYDPVADTFSVVAAGGTNSVEAAAKSKLDRADVSWDAAPYDGDRGRRPEKLRVVFRYPSAAAGSPPYHTTDVTLPTAAGVVAGTVVTLVDDLIVDDPAAQASEITARAAARKDEWLRKFTTRDVRVVRVFRDVRPEVVTVVGGTATRAVFEDRGLGIRSELLSGPDSALENWRPEAAAAAAAAAGEGKSTTTGCRPVSAMWRDSQVIEGDQQLDTGDTFPATLLLKFVDAKGRCECVGGTTAAAEGMVMIRNPTTGVFKSIHKFKGCEADGRFEFKLAATEKNIYDVPNLTWAGKDVSVKFDPECQEGNRLTFTGFQALGLCGPPATSSGSGSGSGSGYGNEKECENLVRVSVECDACSQSNTACTSCLEYIGPPFFIVKASGFTGTSDVYNGDWYLLKDGECDCSWSVTEGDVTVTLTVSGQKITITFSGGGGGATYEYDTLDPLVKPQCFYSHVAAKVSGNNAPSQVAYEAFYCEPAFQDFDTGGCCFAADGRRMPAAQKPLKVTINQPCLGTVVFEIQRSLGTACCWSGSFAAGGATYSANICVEQSEPGGSVSVSATAWSVNCPGGATSQIYFTNMGQPTSLRCFPLKAVFGIDVVNSTVTGECCDGSTGGSVVVEQQDEYHWCTAGGVYSGTEPPAEFIAGPFEDEEVAEKVCACIEVSSGMAVMGRTAGESYSGLMMRVLP